MNTKTIWSVLPAFFLPLFIFAPAGPPVAILYDELAFSENLDDYFRWDVKLGIRMNSPKRKLSQTFFLDFQNVTNDENIFAMQYNEVKGNLGRVNQIGFFPDVLYRIEF